MNTKIYSHLKSLLLSGVFMLSTFLTFAQDRRVTGKVSGADGQGIPGISVLLKGTQKGTTSDGSGSFAINSASAKDVIVLSGVGYAKKEVTVGTQSVINVTLDEDISSLDEVIVTGYTSEKKKDIVGSVSVVNTKTMTNQVSSNLSSMLQGRAAGITVSGTGAPGAGATIRIRGFASFGNNDPLYVIDGVPTDNAQAINPQDIASVQVLKDPVSASIYGSRAANGVIVVTTKQGGNKFEISYDGYYGVSNIQDSKIPQMLNTKGYADYLWAAYAGAGIAPQSVIFGKGASPVIPTYLETGVGGVSTIDPSKYRVFENINPDNYGPKQFYNTSAGTNWFREATQSAPVTSHQISATGGSEKGSYALGLNYFGTEGNYINTKLERYTLRSNTSFKPTKFLKIGQNLQLTYVNQKGANGNPFDRNGGLDFSGEGSPWAQAYRMVPYLPVYYINGGFAGNGVGDSGNGSNPVANAIRGKDNGYQGVQYFGNVYAQINFLKDFTLSTSFGFDQRFGTGQQFNYLTYERAENIKNNNYGEYFFNGGSWTWTNSLQYNKKFNNMHDVSVFAAVESVDERFRGLSGSRTDYDFSDPDFRSIETGKNLPQVNGAPGTPRKLFSIFGKLVYTYDDKYSISATLRRDQSSVFGPENRAAIFPAFGAKWRISGESFMKDLPIISNLALRAGWGQMGSQKNVSPVNQYSFFGAGIGSTGYDITGGNGGVSIGYRPSFNGNPSTKWETATMVNIGLDGSLWNDKVNFSLEYFNNKTSDLLVNRFRNGLEAAVGQPQINVGTMVNKGFDGTVSTKGKVSDISYDVAVTYTAYTNEATKIDADGVGNLLFGAGRLNNIQKIEAGRPLSSFWGYVNEGVFQNQGEVDAWAKMPYKRVGSWKIKDISGPKGVPDGVIDGNDQTYIGNPIPKFQLGADIILKYKNFDFNTFLFWNYGNDIYNYTRYFTDLRGFVGGVSQRVLDNSWSTTNTGGTLPILNINDTYSNSISNSYYIESGSYLRMRTLQFGYTIPTASVKKLGLSRARVYVTGQNMFTITNYLGPDPDIAIQGGDLTMGVDQFRTPQPRTFTLGVSLGF